MSVEPRDSFAAAQRTIEGAEQCSPAIDAVQRKLSGQLETGHAVVGPARVARDEWVECRAQKPCILAGQKRAVVAHPIGSVDKVGERPARWLKLCEHRTHRGKVVGRRRGDQAPGFERLAPGQGEIGPGVVVGDGVVDRAHERQVVGLSGQERQVLAERKARHGRCDRLELAADLNRGIGLHVPQILVSRAAFEHKENERLCLGPGRLAGCRPGREQARQAQADQSGRADVQQVSPRDAIAQTTIAGGDPKHRAALFERAGDRFILIASEKLGNGPRPWQLRRRLSLGREQDDLDATSGRAGGAGVERAGILGAEPDGRDLAGLPPTGRLDRVLINQVFANGVGLFLGEDLGQVAIPGIVGVGSDHDLRGWLAGEFAPAGDLIQAGMARRRQNGAAGFEQVVGGN